MDFGHWSSWQLSSVSFKARGSIQNLFYIWGQEKNFTVVPFGLKIMTDHMQKFMEMWLGDLDVVPFQDDVAIVWDWESANFSRLKQES